MIVYNPELVSPAALRGLAALSLFTVSTNKLCWTRTVVPDARGHTYFRTCSSILTTIILEAAAYACDVTITGSHMVFLKIDQTIFLIFRLYKIIGVTSVENVFQKAPLALACSRLSDSGEDVKV